MRRLTGDGGVNLFRGAHRHRALVDDDHVLGHRATDVARHVEHMLQIGRPILTLRRADGDERDIRPANGVRQIGREGQTFLAVIAENKLGEPRLEDGHLTRLERGDLRRILIHADDVVAVLGEAGAQNQTDVSCSHDCDFHITIRY